MIPAVIAAAFFIWQSQIGTRRATWCTGWLAVTSIFLTLALLTFTHSWTGVIGSTITRSGGSGLGAGVSSVLRSAWSWDGLIFAVATAGTVMAFALEQHWARKLLVLSLTASGILVPAYQAHLGVGWSLDKHMSAGTGLMAIAAGYAFSRISLPHWKPASHRRCGNRAAQLPRRHRTVVRPEHISFLAQYREPYFFLACTAAESFRCTGFGSGPIAGCVLGRQVLPSKAARNGRLGRHRYHKGNVSANRARLGRIARFRGPSQGRRIG